AGGAAAGADAAAPGRDPGDFAAELPRVVRGHGAAVAGVAHRARARALPGSGAPVHAGARALGAGRRRRGDHAWLPVALGLRRPRLGRERGAAAGADLLLSARLGPVRQPVRGAGAARQGPDRGPPGARIQRGARRLPARAAAGDADPRRAVRDRPARARPRPGHPDRRDRRPADLRALPRPGDDPGARRHRRGGPVRRLAAPGRGARGVGHRPGDRELLADAETGRRPHRPASGGGDLRGVRRRHAVRLHRNAAGLAGRRDRQRAAALCVRALHPQPALRRARADHAAAGTGGRRRAGRPRIRRGRRMSEATRQLPLALRYPPDQRLETYVDAPAGVLGQLRALAAGSGEGLYLAGPAGAGKTHLALATCAASEAGGRRAAYLPLKSARGRLRDALEALGEATLVALDGLEAIAGARDDEVALFDFHNRARAAGTGLLYVAQAAPDALPLSLPDLRSRLAQCA